MKVSASTTVYETVTKDQSTQITPMLYRLSGPGSHPVCAWNKGSAEC